MNNWVYAIVIRDHNQEMTIEEKITEENMIDMYFVYFTYNYLWGENLQFILKCKNTINISVQYHSLQKYKC